MLDTASANLRAANALSRCRHGDVEGGLDAYAQVLQEGGARVLPVALHARMLASAGFPEIAERLTLVGLRKGADMSIYGAFGGALGKTDLLKVIEDYRQLFAQGRIDSLMVERYLALLVRVGAYAEVGRILDPALIRRHDLTDDRDGGTVVDPVEITRVLMEHRESGAYRGTFQAIRNSTRIDHVDRLPHPAIASLVRAVGERVERYRADLPPDAHVIMTNVPRRFRLESWCVISETDGYTVPHKHSHGWITCVFYPTAPAEALVSDDDQGALCIGRYDFIPDEAPGWRTIAVAPVPGQLVMMPSYAVHWTKPMKQPGLRIAVAIDICPEP
ncbi:putative 2OG-Fe(II) oxygenase (plasmid) [Tistrella mobilis]|uniref:putative 2OG-Fe(II) oxygenase n=1 Tax=Tistrella mobilis TaxID=171437 RepID=UPI0009EDC9B1|nr:putative 2OG-Fe(II) oxygenase [Tistrella mobilis]